MSIFALGQIVLLVLYMAHSVLNTHNVRRSRLLYIVQCTDTLLLATLKALI